MKSLSEVLGGVTVAQAKRQRDRQPRSGYDGAVTAGDGDSVTGQNGGVAKAKPGWMTL